MNLDSKLKVAEAAFESVPELVSGPPLDITEIEWKALELCANHVDVSDMSSQLNFTYAELCGVFDSILKKVGIISKTGVNHANIPTARTAQFVRAGAQCPFFLENGIHQFVYKYDDYEECSCGWRRLLPPIILKRR